MTKESNFFLMVTLPMSTGLHDLDPDILKKAPPIINHDHCGNVELPISMTNTGRTVLTYRNDIWAVVDVEYVEDHHWTDIKIRYIKAGSARTVWSALLPATGTGSIATFTVDPFLRMICLGMGE